MRSETVLVEFRTPENSITRLDENVDDLPKNISNFLNRSCEPTKLSKFRDLGLKKIFRGSCITEF